MSSPASGPGPFHLVEWLTRDDAVAALARASTAGQRIAARGASGSSPAFTAAALATLTTRPWLLVVAHIDEADEAADELAAAGVSVVRLPALEVLPGESNVSLELFSARLAAVKRVSVLPKGPPTPLVIIAPVQALMQGVPSPRSLGLLSLTVRRGERRPLTDLIDWLARAGYDRVETADEPGTFAVRGGILDVFPPGDPTGSGAAAGGGVPVRLDFFGDEIERLSEVDLDTMGSDRAIDAVEFICAAADAASGASGPADTVSFLDLLPTGPADQGGAGVLMHESMELVEQARGYFERVTDARSGITPPPALLKALQERFDTVVELNQFSTTRIAGDVAIDLPAHPAPSFAHDAADAVKELAEFAPRGTRVVVYCQNDAERSRLGELLADHPGRVETVTAYLHRGFVWGDEGDRRDRRVLVLPYHELMHRFSVRRRTGRGRAGGAADARLKAGRAIDTFLDFAPGDLVVHRDHGIARFVGLVVMESGASRLSATSRLRDNVRKKRASDEALEEYLTLEFAQGAKLHVPATKIDQVQKYVGGFRGQPALSAIGGTRWKKQKDQVFESVRGLASELLRVRAAREHLPGVRFPADTAWQKEFEAEFPYDETEDQLAALAEIKRDMQQERPMDRLLCGDVGYGKTELAIRAAFKAVEFGKQVAVLVPTTVLAEQHERTFRQRFADYPFRVASLSRFKTPREIADTLELVKKGQVDIVVGTHRLLSKDVRFADLGLVIIDEEQRFGVEHKERLLSLRMTVDVLTLSATPIPRTLHMSMLGLRDISSLATAPVDRRAVVTEVIPYNERRIAQAITRELARDGQVYFVHNRVHNIQSVADTVQKLAGDKARVVIGHGQMPDGELEDVILKFVRREADILVCTTIIESGIDIPTANTMVIADADRFGLAELHQLRGRVGRYKHRAYCYLLTPADRPVTDKANKRLKAIEEYSMLGAGFKIAMRDLEIRGAGNILGPEQSGHISAVGYEMYCQLLEKAVRELNGEQTAASSDTAVDLSVSGYIPKAYIPSDLRRMEAYRRLAVAARPEDVAAFQRDVTAAYGSPPPSVRRLVDVTELRVTLTHMGIRTVAVKEKDVVFLATDPVALMNRLEAAQGTVRLIPPKAGAKTDTAEVFYRPPESYLQPLTLLSVLRKHLCAQEPRAQGSDESAPRSNPAPPPRPPRSPR